MNENISYWLISLVFFMVTLLGYVWFRGHVFSWLRAGKRLSKTRIKKLQKGKKNYWWYESIHQEVGMGAMYWLNKIFTILFALTFLLTGWIRVMSIPICVLSIPIFLLMMVMLIFVRVHYNLQQYGASFVLFVKSENGGVDSILADFFNNPDFSSLDLIIRLSSVIFNFTSFFNK